MASAATSKSGSSSVVSQTTTELYDHETWDDFAPRVHQLCRELWPSESEGFQIEKLKGGSYNRIIGIQTPTDQFILRIPRFEVAQQEREMAILHYVRQHTSIPTARIVFFDSALNNPIKEPYVVHTRIKGQDLRVMYPIMSYQQKLAITGQWAQMLLSQLAVRNDFAGIVDTIADDSAEAKIHGFRPFECHSDSEIEDIRLLSKQSILEMFILQFDRWDAAEKRENPDDFPLDHFDRLAVVAQEMDAAGLFANDVFFSLCHLDLAPRNVMADIDETSKIARITGVLDWDSAVFGPNFMVCEPPSWIWAWPEDDDESVSEDHDEIHANDEPATPEDQGLKRKFEEVMGKDMLKFFYMPQYRLARSLFKLAMSGLNSKEAFARTERLIQEWDKLQGKPQLASNEEDPDHTDDESYHSDQTDDEPYHSDQIDG